MCVASFPSDVGFENIFLIAENENRSCLDILDQLRVQFDMAVRTNSAPSTIDSHFLPCRHRNLRKKCGKKHFFFIIYTQYE